MPKYTYYFNVKLTIEAKSMTAAKKIANEQKKAAIAAIKPDTRSVAKAGAIYD
jgi:hypothetical protein